jgi:SPX domain protein involved in polyphosphate accumulation
MNYKLLKKKMHDIVENRKGVALEKVDTSPAELAKDPLEVDFFKSLRYELKKASDFFRSNETLFRIRNERIQQGFKRLSESDKMYDQIAWSRLLAACVQFYKDVLLLENFAIMNYCGFSKILKKHDKMTGFVTRAAFMRNVMSKQNFASYPYISELLVQAEKLFIDIQTLQKYVCDMALKLFYRVTC